MAKANNAVFVIQGTDGDETIVRVFRVTDETKTPLKAAKTFLLEVLKDVTSPLHDALLRGEISYVGGHPVQVTQTAKPTLVGI